MKESYGLWKGLLSTAWQDTREKNARDWLEAVEKGELGDRYRIRDLCCYFRHLWRFYAGKRCSSSKEKAEAIWMMSQLHLEAQKMEKAWKNQK